MRIIENQCIVNFLDVRFLRLEELPERTKNDIFEILSVYNL